MRSACDGLYNPGGAYLGYSIDSDAVNRRGVGDRGVSEEKRGKIVRRLCR